MSDFKEQLAQEQAVLAQLQFRLRNTLDQITLLQEEQKNLMADVLHKAGRVEALQEVVEAIPAEEVPPKA